MQVCRATFFALLTLAAGAPAQATRSGTIFSGPTTGDAMSVYWNPAAMTRLRGLSGGVYSGFNVIHSSYQRDTVNPVTNLPYPRSEFAVVTPTPNGAIVTDAGLDRWRFGLTWTSPLVKGASWDDVVDGKPSSSRYHLIRGISMPFTLGAAVALRVNRWLSLGAGVDLLGLWLAQDVMIDLGARINQITCRLVRGPCDDPNIPIPREDPNFAAPSSLAGVGWGVGGYFGVLLTPLPWLDIGGALHTGNNLQVPLSLTVDVPGTVAQYLASNLPSVSLPRVDGDVSTRAAWPATVTAGVTAWMLARRLSISAFIHWAHTSTGSLVVADISAGDNQLIGDRVELLREASNEMVYHLRGVYRLSPTLDLALLLEVTPATRRDAYLTPATFSLTTVIPHLGLGWQARPWLRVTFEYGHFFAIARTVTGSRFAPNPDPLTLIEEGFDRPSPSGRYSGATERFALGLWLSY